MYMCTNSSWSNLSYAVSSVGGEPTHRCRLPVSMMMNESTPYQYVNGERMFDKCNVYENYSSATNRTMPCRLGWVYESESVTITEQVRVTLTIRVLGYVKSKTGPVA